MRNGKFEMGFTGCISKATAKPISMRLGGGIAYLHFYGEVR